MPRRRSPVPLGLAGAALLGFVVFVLAGNFRCPEETGCTEPTWTYTSPVALAGLAVMSCAALALVALGSRKAWSPWRTGMLLAGIGLAGYAAVFTLDLLDAMPEPSAPACDDGSLEAASCGGGADWSMVFGLLPLTALLGLGVLVRRAIQEDRAIRRSSEAE